MRPNVEVEIVLFERLSKVIQLLFDEGKIILSIEPNWTDLLSNEVPKDYKIIYY